MIIRGRSISTQDLTLIREIIDEVGSRGRTHISRRIAEKWGWLESSGRLKDRAVRDILNKLNSLDMIQLPPRQSTPVLSYKIRSKLNWKPYRLPSTRNRIGNDVRLIPVRDRKNQEIWNGLIAKFHYLGHKTTVGRSCRYIIASDDVLLGAISFTSPTWSIKARDTILEELGISSSEIQDSVINNSRFLILPGVSIPNLASKVLGISTRAVVDDWDAYYKTRPLIAETFVEPTRFLGTCYRAANWVEIGTTQGYFKRGNSHHNGQVPKLIFMYGLTKTIRRNLRRINVVKDGKS